MSQPTRIRSGPLSRRFSSAYCLLLSATFASAVSAVDARAQADKVDEYIEAEMRKLHIPSLSLAVVQGGKVVKTRAYGLANMELNVPATPNTVYQIQSITKSFVACGIMLLVEDGKLGLDEGTPVTVSVDPDTGKLITTPKPEPVRPPGWGRF